MNLHGRSLDESTSLPARALSIDNCWIHHDSHDWLGCRQGRNRSFLHKENDSHGSGETEAPPMDVGAVVKSIRMT